MNIMNLTLVAVHIEPSTRAVPLGPAMLASTLKRRLPDLVTPVILDLFLEETPEDQRARILETRPDAVGISLFVWNRRRALELARLLKQERPELTVFLGGPEATADTDRLLAEPSVDFVIPGEGEDAVARIVPLLAEEMDKEKIRKMLSRPEPPDLEELPSPYLDGTLDPGAYPGLLWELSRGCPFHCDFCFESRGTPGVRRFPMDRIRRELDRFRQRDVRQVFVLDPTFNYQAPRAKEILRLLIEKGDDIQYTMEIRAEFLDEEMAELFSMLDCTLQIGLQSADPAVLKNIHRKLDPERFREKIFLLHEAGVPYGFDLIYGLPGDDPEGFARSLDFALDMAPNHVDLFPLSILPGTKLSETAATFGLEYLRHPPYTVLSTPGFGQEGMPRAGRLARACDFFYNRGKAVPWFGFLYESLERSPAAFMETFANWLEKKHGVVTEDVLEGISPAGVVERQRRFLEERIPCRRNDPKAARVASDIVACFGFSALLSEGESLSGDGDESDTGKDFCRVRLSHDPRELMERIDMGITDIGGLSRILPEEEREWIFHLEDGEVMVRPADD